MSLYNSLFGVNASAPVLLKILGIDIGDIPRFRDCYLMGRNIVIHTRTGGGNRDFYESKNEDNQNGPWNSTLEKNEYYICDEDDEFDSTYANFYFCFPEEYKKELEDISNGVKVETPSEKWQKLIDTMSEGKK